MKHIVCICLMLSLPLLKAQSSVGFDLQINNDHIELKDPGSEIKKSLSLNVSPALLYRWGFARKIAFSTGLRLKVYSENITFGRFMGTFSSLSNASLQIPLHFEKNISILKGLLSVNPMLGANYNILLVKSGGMGGTTSNLKDSISFNSVTKDARSSFFTVSSGLSVEYRFSASMSIALYWQYTRGFATFASQQISYQVNGSQEIQAQQNNKGTYMTYLGLKIYYHFTRRIKTVNDKKE